MTDARLVTLLVTLAAAVAATCGPRHAAGPANPVRETIALLPDSDSGVVGRATVSNPSGSVNLTGAREATTVVTNRVPSTPRTLSEAEVSKMFGSALSALPAPPRHFTLYFKFNADELTDESRAMLPDILATVKQNAVPDVSVVGHTDTTGTTTANFELGMKRATAVRDLLVQAGLETAAIATTSHGESELLIPTADDVAEPRNRRVEISVR